MRTDRHTYVPAFDGLRGLAVLPVVLLHVGMLVLPNNALLRTLTRGWYGVDLFFVLSGFLITSILSREIEATGTIDVKRFYFRRFLRLIPAYASTLIAVLIGAAVLDPSGLREVPRVLPALMTGTYNYQIAFGGPHIDVLVVVWSLCVEEQFYFVWPLILRRLDLKHGMRWCIGAIAAFSFYRTVLYAFFNWGHLGRPGSTSAIWIYFATDTRIGVILIGCAAALSLKDRRVMAFWHRMRQRRLFPWIALAIVCACIIFVTGGAPSTASWRSATFGYTLAGAATAMLVVAVFLQPWSAVARMLSWGPLVSLGTISYGVYLFHLPIARLLLILCRRLKWADPVLVLSTPLERYLAASFAVITLTWIIAALHYERVERKILKKRPAIAAPHPAGREAGEAERPAAAPAGVQAELGRESGFPAQIL